MKKIGIKFTYSEVKDFINSLGYELITKEYNNAHEYLDIMDKDGYKYSSKLMKLRESQSPKKFHKNNPHTIENIKNYLIINNYTCQLLSEEYSKTSKDKLKWKCQCGKIFERSLDGVMASKGICLKCIGQEKIDFDEIIKMSKEKGLTPLFEGYKNVDDKIDFITKEGYLVQTTISYLTRYKGEYKRIFHTSNDFSLENIKRYLKLNNIKTELISNKYSNKELCWKCGQCGELYYSKFSNFKNSTFVCPDCSDKNGHDKLKLNHSQISDYIQENTDFELIDILGIGRDSELILKCSCGEIVKTNFSNIRYGLSRCKICSGKVSYGEYVTENILKLYELDFISQHTFENCKHEKVLYFDFYLPKYNLCIEIDGEQHRRPIDIFGGVEEFNKTKIRDAKKDMFCKNNNIVLVRIPYYSDNKNKFKKEVDNTIKSLIS